MTTKYGGYTGRVIKIDLGSGKLQEYPWSDEERFLFYGGKTMAAKIISDHLSRITGPLDPSNLLVITTGPLTGTGAPSSGRFNISTISPLTGILTSSNCGGSFGYYLKKAGYDGLILCGRSEKPVWLDICDHRFVLRDAADLWGRKTGETQEVLEEKLRTAAGGRKTKNGKMVIGPAGENLVKYASIVSEERLAGRGGVGAVMGSKNLKAVTARGNHTVTNAEPEKMKALNKKWFRYLKKHPLTGDQLPRLGTAGLVSGMQINGQLSTGNYQYGQFDRFEAVSGETLAEKHNLVNKGCLSCPIKCARTVEVDGKSVKGPELETLGLLGAGIFNDSMEHILRWNYELDELGMDTISAANTVAYAMEARERGLWENGLSFGETDGISRLWEDIAYRRGIGEELAEGSKALSEKYGGKEFAMQVKGMELAAYEPRRSVGLGLGYAVSNRGGCHLNGGYLVILEGLGLNVDAQTPKGKAETAVIFQNLMESTSACGQCIFTTYGFFPPPVLKHPHAWYTKMVNKALPAAGPVMRLLATFPEVVCFHLPYLFNQSLALKYATGMDVTFGRYLKTGSRGYTLERLINTRLGISSKDDSLPGRLTEEEQIAGDASTKVPLEQMKVAYYKARGWDQNGIPTEKALRRLRLDRLPVAQMAAKERVEKAASVRSSRKKGGTEDGND